MGTQWLAYGFLASVVCCAVAATAGCAGGGTSRNFVVAQDGSGQFTTITAALEAANDATAENPIDIVIKPGTYVETLTTRDWVNLVGADRDSCVVKYDGGGEDVVHKHTIWATTNTTIRNLTLIGIRVKYCIHSDGGGPYVLRVENCVLRRENPVPWCAFGIGLHSYQHIVVRGCVLEADLPLYLHNWNDQVGSCSMTLENCTLKANKDYAAEIINLGSRQPDFVVFHDCVMQGQKASVRYAASRRQTEGAPPWQGPEEITLVGSGNTMAGVVGAEMQDDSRERLSGIERADGANPLGAHPKPPPPLPKAELRTAAAPKLDGSLDDPVWKGADWVTFNRRAEDGVAVAVSTQAAFLRDDRFLYVGARCAEPLMDRVRDGIRTRGGKVWSENDVEIFIDPGTGGARCYQFVVNSLGTIFEAQYAGPRMSGWVSKGQAAARRGSDFWSAEVAIPIEAFGVSEVGPGQEWKVNVCRVRLTVTPIEATAWSTTIGGFYVPRRFGTLVVR